MTREELDSELIRLAATVGSSFRTFGGGEATLNNPMAIALKDKPLMFAAGVDVKDVVLATLVAAFQQGLFKQLVSEGLEGLQPPGDKNV